MKITILVGGRFHAFNLAEEIDKKGYLLQLITSYPKFYIKKNFKIDIKKIRTIIAKEIISRIPFINRILDDYISNYFERTASKILNFNETDILVGWSGFSLASFQKAQKHKVIKILERGSTHIKFQRDILLQEYNRLGIKPNLPSKNIIDKELKEYELADYIIVPSEFAKKTFIDKGFQNEKIIKIPYGVNIHDFQKEITKKDTNIYRFIYVGQCSVRKGIVYLLRAFSDLNLENSELIIVGNIDKELKPLLSKFFNNKKIKFYNSQKQKDLNKFYNISDAFITCSLEEGLSMVQLQAMACELPLICTPNSGSEDIIDTDVDGFIIPIRDVEMLKNKMKFLYENPDISRKMGKNAKKKSTNYLTWKKYGEKIIKNYLDILNKQK